MFQFTDQYLTAMKLIIGMMKGVINLERVSGVLNLPDGHEHALSCYQSGSLSYGVE